MHTKPIFFGILGFMLLVPLLFAGQNTWTHMGPEGGETSVLVIDPGNPQIMYAGLASANGYIYRSTDSGASWTSIRNGLDQLGVIHSLVIDPQTPATIFMGTENRGVFKSIDRGNSWVSVSSWSYPTQVRALAIDPKTPTTIYAGTSDKGVFRSQNQGSAWVPINTGLGTMQIESLAVDPQAPSNLYVGTYDKGLYRSTDQGANWVAGSFGSGNANLRVMALAINPTSPDVLYAGTTNGVYRSTNRGENWLIVAAGMNSRWIEALAVDPQTPDTLYAGADNGLYRSENRGNSWNWVSNDLYNHNVYAISIHPQSTGTLYIGTRAGIHLSRNRGISWSTANSGIMHTTVNTIAVDPQTAATLYAGTEMGLFRSTDRGTSWLTKQTSIEVPNIHIVALDPRDTKTVYAGTCCGLYQSKDQGDSWIFIGNDLSYGDILSLAIDPLIPSNLYVGTGRGISRSTDSGRHWSPINAGLNPSLENLEVRALAIDPTKVTTLYAGTAGGVYRSTDQGDSWTAMNTGLLSQNRNIRSLVVDSKTPTKLYAGTERGIFLSTDGGGHWEASSAGLEHYFINALILDPQKPTTLYTATDGGFYRSTDSGDSWYSQNYNLEASWATSLAVDPNAPNRLYAGLERMGAYNIDLVSGPTTTAVTTTVVTTTRVTTTVVTTTSSSLTTSTGASSSSTILTIPLTSTTTTAAGTSTTISSSTTSTIIKPSGPAYIDFETCGGSRGGIIRLELRYFSTLPISDLQFDFLFNNAALTFLKAEEGPQAQLAGKVITRSELQAGHWQVKIGSNNNKVIIESGVIATLQMQVAAAAFLGPTPIRLNKVQGLPPQGGTAYSLPDAGRNLEILTIPILDYITPNSGREGNLLVLRGSQFGGCLSSTRVTFSGADGYQTSVTPLEVSPQRMVVTIPSDARGTMTVSVNVSDVPARNSFSFKIDPNQPFSQLATEMEDSISLGNQALPAGAVIDVRSNLAYIADSFNSKIIIVDVASGSKVTDQAVSGGSPVRLGLDSDHGRLVVTQSQTNSVTLFQILADGKLNRLAQLQVGANPLGVAVDPGLGVAVVVNNSSSSVSLVDLPAGRVTGTLPVGKNPLDATVNPANHRAYVINSGDNSVTEIDLVGSKVVRTVNGVGSRPLSVQFHPESGTLLVGSESGLLAADVERNNFVPLLTGQAVDGLAVHTRRGVANAVNNGTGKLTTVDIVAALNDAARSVVGVVPMRNAAVRNLAVNALTNEGIATHSSTAGLSREQADSSGVSRITLSSSLNFPRLMLNPQSDIFAVALSNPLTSPGTLQMTALNTQGQRVQGTGVHNPATLSLPSGGQLAKLETEPDLFGGGIQSTGNSWYKLVSQNPGLKAFFLTADSQFRQSIVGADETGLLLSELILPAVRRNARIALSLLNPMPFSASTSMMLFTDSGKPAETVALSIPAYGMVQKNLEDLFASGIAQIVEGGYVRISSTAPLRGYQLLLPQGRLDAAGINAQSAVSGPATLYFPYFVVGREGGSGIDYETRVGLVNLESSDRSVTLSAYNSGGALLASPRSVQIPGNGRAEPELRNLFGLPNTLTQGWLKVEGQGRLAGYLTYATSEALAAVVSLAEPRTRLTFSHVAEQGTGFFTGLALLNTNTEAVNVTITVYKADGVKTATSPPQRIAPNGQLVGLLNQLVGAAVIGQSGGYVVVGSELPLHGIEIFGTADGRALANVPGQ